MAINKAMKLALKALSYPDVKNFYKIHRAVLHVKEPLLLKPYYRTFDRKIFSNGNEVSVRVYPPKENSKNIFLFFHGGGWVTENVDTYNKVCKTLAKKTNSRVISVDYRLAPEHPFPAALEDCYAVAKELFLNPDFFDIEPEDVILIGDSAGGNLAAAVSLMARDLGEFAIKKQILIYPATFNDHSENSPFPSVIENSTGYLLTSKHICQYMDLYKKTEEDKENPYFAPLLAKDLSNMPKTLIITAEFDPLRDEGEAFGNALKEHGNSVEVHRLNDALHGFFSLDYRFVHVKKTYDLIMNFLK